MTLHQQCKGCIKQVTRWLVFTVAIISKFHVFDNFLLKKSTALRTLSYLSSAGISCAAKNNDWSEGLVT